MNRLIERRENGLIKVVTGIRRCGKSYLLFKLYYQYLLVSGIEASRIIKIPLDDDEYEELRESKRLSAYIKKCITDEVTWFIFLDEVQMCRGFNVDVGVVERSERDESGKVIRKKLEVDFVCNRGNQRYYIQSAFPTPDNDKMQQEQKSLVHIGDSFKKIIVEKDQIKLWRNEEGIVIMGIMDFLLNPNSLEL